MHTFKEYTKIEEEFYELLDIISEYQFQITESDDITNQYVFNYMKAYFIEHYSEDNDALYDEFIEALFNESIGGIVAGIANIGRSPKKYSNKINTATTKRNLATSKAQKSGFIKKAFYSGKAEKYQNKINKNNANLQKAQVRTQNIKSKIDNSMVGKTVNTIGKIAAAPVTVPYKVGKAVVNGTIAAAKLPFKAAALPFNAAKGLVKGIAYGLGKI